MRDETLTAELEGVAVGHVSACWVSSDLGQKVSA